MTLKPLFAATSAMALALAAAPASADQQAVIDAIVADLSAQGFNRIEIGVERNGFDVDAYGGGREGDFYFTSDGHLVSSDIDDDDDDEDRSSRGTPAVWSSDDDDDDEDEGRWSDSSRWDSDDDDDDDDEDDDDDDDGDYDDDDDDDDDYDDD